MSERTELIAYVQGRITACEDKLDLAVKRFVDSGVARDDHAVSRLIHAAFWDLWELRAYRAAIERLEP